MLGRCSGTHNQHEDPNEYHHRVLDPHTEDTIFYETLHRHQFPIAMWDG